MRALRSDRTALPLMVALALFGAMLVIPAARAANSLPLSLGERGPAVIELQTRLRGVGYDPGPIDGIFGARTEVAVRSFQTSRSLGVTGVVDGATWTALSAAADPVLTVGSRGSRVLELQRRLVAAGHDPGPRDGIFGTKTAAATSAFQRSVALPVTGAVDQATWERLFTTVVLLRRGATGPEVLEVQQHLAALGYPAGTPDGKFGLLTEAAVRAFQSGIGLAVTGEVDLLTRDRLRSEDTGPGAVLLWRGDRGSAVLALQNRLARTGYSPGILDGGYGEKTTTAVLRFQATFRLPGDGDFNEVTDDRLRAFEREAERGYAAGYVPGAGVEQWRNEVTEIFALWGLDREACADTSNPATCVGPQIEAALDVMNCESKGVPFAVNLTSGVTGLFQHRMAYWAERVGRVRVQFPSFPADASAYDPKHNIMVSALLVWESRGALLRNLAAGHTMDEGPHPWSHWSCKRAIG